MPTTGNLGLLGLDVDNIMVEDEEVDKVYNGNVLVWERVNGGPVSTVTIIENGFVKVASGSGYTCIQRSTTGSGTGFTCTATINNSFDCTAVSITNGGSGYVVGDEITLDFTTVADGSREVTYVELEVTAVT